MNLLIQILLVLQLFTNSSPAKIFEDGCDSPLATEFSPGEGPFGIRRVSAEFSTSAGDNSRAIELRDATQREIEAQSVYLAELIQRQDYDGFLRYCYLVGSEPREDIGFLDHMGSIIDLGWDGALLYLQPEGTLFSNLSGPLLTAYILAWRGENSYGLHEFLIESRDKLIASAERDYLDGPPKALPTPEQRRTEGIFPMFEGRYAPKSDRALATYLYLVKIDPGSESVLRRLYRTSERDAYVSYRYARTLEITGNLPLALEVLGNIDPKDDKVLAKNLAYLKELIDEDIRVKKSKNP